MLRTLKTLLLLLMLPLAQRIYAQSDQHYTMFLYNKLLYNPGYTGSRDITSVNGDYRNQWSGISGAPKTFNMCVDGTAGSYMLPFRKIAVGMSIAGEQIGVERNTNMMGYYAYRIPFKNSSVLSLGIRAGIKLYSANYSDLNLSQQNDNTFSHDIRNAVLPNAGVGAYWCSNEYYAGISVPNLLQNYYDKTQNTSAKAKEVRGYYACGGYVFTLNETIKLVPQALVRYAGNSRYQLPINCDINASAIFYNRLMAGITYRTDKSFEGIIHVQATKNMNIGYAYDYLVSDLQGYDHGAHEIVVGFDFIRDNSKYLTPRIIRAF